ncbi:50S ribosomal protein L24 [bacterium]|nr:50S ribosomal protein L24 [bacterium]
MKLKLKDKVMIIAGRDKGKTGEIMAVLPKLNKVVVAGVNVVKRHAKPTTQNPKGGIIELTKPIDSAKVMILDPKTNKPARVGYKVTKNGKERVFKVAQFGNKKTKKATEKPAEKKAEVKK